MRIIVGLGNPGQKYKNNRHNVGHMFINYLIKELRITNYGFKTFKTDCFMNQSGIFVKKLIRNSQCVIDNLIITHDDLDIPLGKFKIQKGTGPKLHNGLESIENELGTNDFWRIRIGVDNRPTDNRINGEAYVLQDFKDEEKKIIHYLFPEIYSRLKESMI